MVKRSNKVNCPVCANSSGVKYYTGNPCQKCEDCNGTGKISIESFNLLKEKYGDLISIK